MARIFSLLILLMAQSAFAIPGLEILIHGTVGDAAGVPVSGSRAYQISFFNSSTGGSLLGSTITGTVEVTERGIFAIPLPLEPAVLLAPEVWYEIGIDTDVPADEDASDDVFPERVKLYSVPYALRAQEVAHVSAESIGAGTVDDVELGALDGISENVQAQLDALDADISTNAADIDALETTVGQGTGDISALQADLGQAQSDISALDGGLQALESDVQTQAGDISTLQTTVSQQATDIAAKANAADVYTTSESDSNFVDATGDTVNGDLSVSGTVAAPITLIAPEALAPAETSDRLYNINGTLFWDGLQLSGASVSKDQLNNAGSLSFEWNDSEIADDLTVGAGGSVHADAFSALDDLQAESAIGTGAGQVAAGDHNHFLGDLQGEVIDSQVVDTLTIAGGAVNNDSFSALSDLSAENAIGSGAGQVAAGNHLHNLEDLGGAVTDAQVPNDITITENDTLDSVMFRGASTNSSITLGGNVTLNNATAQEIHFTGGTAVHSIESDSVLGLQVDGTTFLDGTISGVSRTLVDGGDATAPGYSFNGDGNTGISSPSNDVLTLSTNGQLRLSLDTSEANFGTNVLEIVNGSAPSTTTNKLYNAGGNLFWNGTQLNGGGGGGGGQPNYDTISIDFYWFDNTWDGYPIWAMKMPANGRIVGMTTFSAEAGDAAIMLSKNGSDILSSRFGFQTDTVVDELAKVTDVNFVTGDELKMNIQVSNDNFQMSVTLTVEYQ